MLVFGPLLASVSWKNAFCFEGWSYLLPYRGQVSSSLKLFFFSNAKYRRRKETTPLYICQSQVATHIVKEGLNPHNDVKTFTPFKPAFATISENQEYFPSVGSMCMSHPQPWWQITFLAHRTEQPEDLVWVHPGHSQNIGPLIPKDTYMTTIKNTGCWQVHELLADHHYDVSLDWGIWRMSLIRVYMKCHILKVHEGLGGHANYGMGACVV